MQQYPKNKLAQAIIQHCITYNIKNVIISPGSRNAPLTIGFSNHPNINAISIVDERSAAFFALGIAQQTQNPVAVVCTSGSALLNYYPAVAEAFYSNIPLVIISADRPKYLIDIGDGQTVRQENVFQNHILFSANLIDTDDAEKNLVNNKLIDKALQTVICKNGPIHINVPFDEPLYETVNELEGFNAKKENILLEEVPLDIDELQKFVNIWNDSSKKMILIGTNYPDELLQLQLNKIIKDESVIVLIETTSNVCHDKFINSIDKVIIPFKEENFEQLKPDILLTLGGMIVSKKVKQFLRKHQPKHHWHIDKYSSPDTFHCLNHHFKVSSQLFFSQFLMLNLVVENSSQYQQKWLQIKAEREINHHKYLSKVEYSDLQVFDSIFKQMQNNIHLQLANSSIIRYTQLFNLNKNFHVFCNRGTSGIEGSTSTALGAAYIERRQTLLITGDISFFYDSNALWNNYIKNDFRIILINNSGGGIFRFIPGPKSTNALNYFETPHNLDASNLCNMFGFEYAFAKNNDEVKNQLKLFYNKSNKPKLLEIFTPNTINDKVLKAFFDFL
ncbi:MAG: 2-succinyl-5-enolpyruvyl-6-hydroxy-3-cyclohexene-1-carboxylic-acid synthase [Flavobacteriaceae bacterium]|nr:2-succinyl-5-enolpyruvyl-6-hydroxy-3-cyclohexene-1-carboxylic-acid synthase [Flavobacteriaceae bacterium]